MSKKAAALGLLVATAVLPAASCRRADLLERVGGAAAVEGVFRRAHASVYRVYDIGPQRDALWDLLAGVFDGDALTSEYVEHFTTLVRMGREQTEVHVLSVDYESVKVVPAGADRIEVAADWSVGGIVRHQRHGHHRVNRYQAVYTLAETAGHDPADLRIVDSRLQSAERLRNPLGDPRAFPLDDVPTSRRGLVGPAELLRSGVLDDDSPDEPAEPAADDHAAGTEAAPAPGTEEGP